MDPPSRKIRCADTAASSRTLEFPRLHRVPLAIREVVPLRLAWQALWYPGFAEALRIPVSAAASPSQEFGATSDLREPPLTQWQSPRPR